MSVKFKWPERTIRVPPKRGGMHQKYRDLVYEQLNKVPPLRKGKRLHEELQKVVNALENVHPLFEKTNVDLIRNVSDARQYYDCNRSTYIKKNPKPKLKATLFLEKEKLHLANINNKTSMTNCIKSVMSRIQKECDENRENHIPTTTQNTTLHRLQKAEELYANCRKPKGLPAMKDSVGEDLEPAPTATSTDTGLIQECNILENKDRYDLSALPVASTLIPPEVTTPDIGSRTYTSTMREQLLKGEEESELRRKIIEKSKDGTLVTSSNGDNTSKEGARKRGRCWDQAGSESFVPAKAATPSWEEDKTPADHRWDETPAHAMTPGHEKSAQRNRWDETPKTERETPGHSGWAKTPKLDRSSSSSGGVIETTPGSSSKRSSRWNETPSMTLSAAMTPSLTPNMTPHATPGHVTPMLTPGGTTPIGIKAMSMATPTPGALAAMTPEQLQAYRWENEIDERNRPPFTDEELDQMLPPGYKILPPPVGHVPLRTPGRKLMATATPSAGVFIQVEDKNANQPKGHNLPFMHDVDEELSPGIVGNIKGRARENAGPGTRPVNTPSTKVVTHLPPLSDESLSNFAKIVCSLSQMAFPSMPRKRLKHLQKMQDKLIDRVCN